MRRLVLISLFIATSLCAEAQINILVPPANKTMCYNEATSQYDPVTFSVNATVGVGTLSYQWQVSTNGGGVFSNITDGNFAGIIYSGTTTSTLSVIGTNAANNYQYRAVVSCASCGGLPPVNSVAGILSLPFTLNPEFEGPLCAGSALTFKANPVGPASTIEWTFQGGVIDNNFNHSIPTPVLANAGPVKIIAATAGGCKVRYDANVVLETIFNIGLTNPGPFCQNLPVTLTATSGVGVQYTWTYPATIGGGKACGTVTSCSTDPIIFTNPGTYDYLLLLDNGKNGNEHCATTKTFQLLLMPMHC
jgi:hypothetical protein